MSSPYNPTSHSEFPIDLFLLFIFALILYLGIICVCHYCRSSTSADNPTLAVPAPTAAATNQKVGLDPSIIGSLPVVTYGGAAEEGASEECPICLNQFEESETVKSIPHCGHVYHGRCIDTWLSSHVTCPLCRSTKMFNDVEEGISGVRRSRGCA